MSNRTTTPSIVGIAGNVTRPSRTAALVDTILAAIEERTGFASRKIELTDAAPTLFRALRPDLVEPEAREIIEAVENADLLVVATPVYRGSYTGALKHLFDLARREAFANKPVILAATGGSPLHGLVIEHQLRPLFGFFNALTIPTAIYATEVEFQNYRLIDPTTEQRIGRAVDEAVSFLDRTSDFAFTAPRRADGVGAAA